MEAELQKILKEAPQCDSTMTPEEFCKRFLKSLPGALRSKDLRKCSALVKMAYVCGTPERTARDIHAKLTDNAAY